MPPAGGHDVTVCLILSCDYSVTLLGWRYDIHRSQRPQDDRRLHASRQGRSHRAGPVERSPLPRLPLPDLDGLVSAMTTKPVPGMGRPCYLSAVPGVLNDSPFENSGVPRCEESTTHSLYGKPLCHKHWIVGLEARKKADRRMQSYSNQLRNYQR